MFDSPQRILYLIPVLLVWAAPFLLKTRGIRFSSLEVGTLHSGWRSKVHYLPALFLLLSALMLTIVIAEPVKPPAEKDYKREGIAVELVIDCSGSMNEKMLDGLRAVRKMDLVKEVAVRFVMGDDGELSGRNDDLIGVVTFAKYANTVYPLTFNRGPFPEVMRSVDIVDQKVDGTHFGAGLETAIARLETLDAKEDANIKSRVIIFLTDGLNRIENIDPLEMARRARDKNIRIYTIAFATRQQELLEYIARISDGKSFSASGSGALLDVYREIDAMEKSRLGDVKPVQGEPDSYRYLTASLLSALLAFGLSWTIFRRFP